MRRKRKSEGGRRRPRGGGGSPQRRRHHGSFEYTFLVTVTFALIAIGVVMVLSASWANAFFGENQDSYYYLKRELIFVAIGLVCMFGLARYNYRHLRKAAPAMMLFSLGLLVLVFLPGFGVSAKGATRWLGFGLASFQPSEFAKLAIILYVATVIYARPQLLSSLKRMAIPVLALPMLACILILVQPDMGTAIAIVAAVTGILLVGGIRLRDLSVLAVVAGAAGSVFIYIEPYRLDRLTAFINPWADASESGFQIIQSLVALGSGGLFGVGVGESIQKFNYLPEAHTDMILSIIGEELGLVGIMVVAIAYVAFAYIGYRIALNCCDLFGKYLAAGITTLLVSQASINFCAVMGLLPLTGIPLPMISYGGSSLVVILSSIGILLNIAINPRGKVAATPERKFKTLKGGNRGGRDGRASGAGPGARRRAHG